MKLNLNNFSAFRASRSKLLLGLPVLIALYFLAVWNYPLSNDDDTHVVQSGQSLTSISRELYKKNVLPDSFSFKLLARLTGSSTEIKAGEYRFESGMSQHQILSAMVKGEQVLYSVLLVEGSRFSDLIKSLSENPKLEKTLTDLTAAQIMERLSYGKQHPEGRFFPDTYTFTAGTKDFEILRQSYSKMQLELENAWNNRQPDLPYKNIEEVLIMASIVEKETGTPEDRSKVAAVFVNRLRKKMKLQTDPTVIYGMGSKFKGNIRKRDLLKDTPYNTYTRRGLPPTPISLPGLDSIKASLHPASTNDLYFVARGDGSSQFSETYKEHDRAVRKYQLGGNRKKRSRTK